MLLSDELYYCIGRYNGLPEIGIQHHFGASFAHPEQLGSAFNPVPDIGVLVDAFHMKRRSTKAFADDCISIQQFTGARKTDIVSIHVESVQLKWKFTEPGVKL